MNLFEALGSAPDFLSPKIEEANSGHDVGLKSMLHVTLAGDETLLVAPVPTRLGDGERDVDFTESPRGGQEESKRMLREARQEFQRAVVLL